MVGQSAEFSRTYPEARRGMERAVDWIRDGITWSDAMSDMSALRERIHVAEAR